MNRREFLLFRADRSDRVVELSCQQLYMRLLDAEMASAPPLAAGHGQPDPWGNEPAPVFEARMVPEILDAIGQALTEVDVVRLRDARWLAAEPLQQAIEGLLAPFRARGGRVEILS